MVGREQRILQTPRLTHNIALFLALYAILLSCVKTKDFQIYLAQCDDMWGLMQEDLLLSRLAINDCRFICYNLCFACTLAILNATGTSGVPKHSAIMESFKGFYGDYVPDHPLCIDNSSWPEAMAHTTRDREKYSIKCVYICQELCAFKHGVVDLDMRLKNSL